MLAQMLVVASAALLAEPRDPLSILRVTPQDDAAPTSTITVTFDRPVAGSLDRSIDPTSIFRITPAVAGSPAFGPCSYMRTPAKNRGSSAKSPSAGMERWMTGTTSATASRSTTSFRCATKVSDSTTTGDRDSSAALKASTVIRKASSTPFG